MADRTTEEAKREAFDAWWMRGDGIRAADATGWRGAGEAAWKAALQWQAEQQKGEAPSMPATWSVEVIDDGVTLVSIGESWLSGARSLGKRDEQTILGAAMHLLSFIGHGLPPSNFDPDETAASPHGVPLSDALINEIWDQHSVPVFGKTGINPVVFARALLKAAALPQAPQGEIEAAAWRHVDDPRRVISAAQKDDAMKDGGASASSVARYSIPLIHRHESSAPPPLAQGDSQ